MLSFKSNLSTINQPILLNSQCQISLRWDQRTRLTVIRSSSIGNKVLTAWIDEREGDSTRVYGNFFDVDQYTGIEQKENMIPAEFSISQNYPNPFNPSTTIDYDLPKTANVKIDVYSITGQKIKTLINKKMPAGYHEIEFNGQDLASGIYYHRIETGEF